MKVGYIFAYSHIVCFCFLGITIFRKDRELEFFVPSRSGVDTSCNPPT